MSNNLRNGRPWKPWICALGSCWGDFFIIFLLQGPPFVLQFQMIKHLLQGPHLYCNLKHLLQGTMSRPGTGAMSRSRWTSLWSNHLREMQQDISFSRHKIKMFWLELLRLELELEVELLRLELELELLRPGTGKIWTVEGDEKLDEKMEEGDLKRFHLSWLFKDTHTCIFI